MADSIYSNLELLMGYRHPFNTNLADRLLEAYIKPLRISWDVAPSVWTDQQRQTGRLFDARFEKDTRSHLPNLGQVSLRTTHPLDHQPLFLLAILTNRCNATPWLVFSSRAKEDENWWNPVGYFLSGDEMTELFNDTRPMSDEPLKENE